VDEGTRRGLYVQMQKRLVEDAPVVFLYMHPRLAVARREWQGFWQDLPAFSGDLSEVSWTPAK
jgi:ABC-type transport system substrate-binding protein